MKRKNESELNELIRWITNINQMLGVSLPFSVFSQEADRINNLISIIAAGIADEYPYYSNELPQIGLILFNKNAFGSLSVNLAAFGELFAIIKHIEREPSDTLFWRDIHPRITGISKALFVDEYYSSAAEKAIKEVEARLRELFSELKPNAGVPSKVNDIIGALLSENGVLKFGDAATQSGKDFRRGVQQLFEGTIAAYRNPSAHANLDINRRMAIEQIVLASQLMYILDIQ